MAVLRGFGAPGSPRATVAKASCRGVAHASRPAASGADARRRSVQRPDRARRRSERPVSGPSGASGLVSGPSGASGLVSARTTPRHSVSAAFVIQSSIAFTGISVDVDGRPVFEVREHFYKGELVAHAKTAAGARAVPLTPELARRLRERRLCSPYSQDQHPIFATLRGTHIDAANWRRNIWRPAREAAGLPWATPHTLRHSLASLLLQNGHTIEQIAAWLGHEDSSFTVRTYVHTREMGSAEFLDRVLGAGSTSS